MRCAQNKYRNSTYIVNFSMCLLNNSETLGDIFLKLGTNIKGHQMMCREGLHNSTYSFHLRVGQKSLRKLTQLRPRSHPRHIVGKRTAQKDAIKDTTSDSQVNNCFPYRWPPASLTLNIYFYLFSYITRITINNGTPHLQPQKNQNRRAALGRTAINYWGASTSLRSTNP